MGFVVLLFLVCIAVFSVPTTTTSSHVQASATGSATDNDGGRNTPVPGTNATAHESGTTHARLLDIVERYSLVMNLEVDAALYHGLKTDSVAVLKEYRAQGSSREEAIELLHAGIRGVFKLRGSVVKDALASGKLSQADRTTIIEHAHWSLEIFKSILSTLADVEYGNRWSVHVSDVLNGSHAGKTALCLAVELKLLDVVQEVIGAGASVCHCGRGECKDGSRGMASSCLAVLLPAVLNADKAMFSLLIAEVESFFTLDSISGRPKLDEWLCDIFNELGENSLSLFQTAYLQCVLVSVCAIYDYIIHRAGHHCSLNLKNSKVDLVLHLPYTEPQCHAIHQHSSLVIDLTSANFHPPKRSHSPQRSYLYSASPNGVRKPWKQWAPWWYIDVSDRTRASGWSLYSDFSVGRGGCDLPRVRVDELGGNTFRLHKYLNVPVVIEGATHGWGVWEEWRKENLKSHWGHLDLLLGTIPYAELFGEMSGYASIQETLDYMDSYAQQEALQYLSTGTTDKWGKIELPFYVFDSEVLGAHFSEHYSIPTYFSNWTEAAQINQFILGPAGSGAPFHYHCPALNALIYGRKKWFLLPPGHAVYSKQHPLRWYSQHYPSLPDSSQQPVECVQRPGDMLYVPAGWSHATINLDEALGLAVELDLLDC